MLYNLNISPQFILFMNSHLLVELMNAHATRRTNLMSKIKIKSEASSGFERTPLFTECLRWIENPAAVQKRGKISRDPINRLRAQSMTGKPEIVPLSRNCLKV